MDIRKLLPPGVDLVDAKRIKQALRLLPYVCPDDSELDEKTFRRFVSDRIRDDINMQ